MPEAEVESQRMSHRLSNSRQRRKAVAHLAPTLRSPAPLTPWMDSLDLVAALAVTVLAGLIAAIDAGGPALGVRGLLGALVVFFVPGYLLMEVLFPPRDPRSPPKALRLVMALGLSPPLVALLALSTALVHGGFRPQAIIAVIALACMALGAAAMARRGLLPILQRNPASRPSPTEPRGG